MNKKKAPVYGLLAALLVAAGGCADNPSTESEADASRESLLATDRNFAASALTEGVVVAYERYIADDAVQLPDGALPLVGKEAIMANVEGAEADNEFSLSWEPFDASVAASGDLGYTWGNYFLEGIDITGSSFEAEGKYASVWRYSQDEGWKVVLDISNENEILIPEELDFDVLTEEFGAD